MIAAFGITSKSTPSGNHTFPKGSKIEFRLDIADAPSCERAWFYYGDDGRVLEEREVEIFKNASSFSCATALDTASLPAPDGLYFCHFELLIGGVRYYTAFDYDNSCYLDTKFVNETQFLVYDEQYSPPEWIFGGAMYQIFPDRFAKGGNVTRREDAIYDDDWENGIPEYPQVRGEAFPNNKHFGGTLWGVESRLDYLKGLGINCIYLNPIFEAYSNHKYDTADFLSVDKSFGGDSALQSLIASAHARGIKIILDGVFNHVGNDSVYFDAYGKYGSGACQSRESEYFDWFKFDNYPNTYECWWGITNLPRTVRCESYISFITEQVIPKYMNMGVDGFRLDVADELECGFLDRITASIKAIKPDAIVIGEVWEDASNKIAYGERRRYFRGSQLDSVTNYPFRNAIIDFVKYGNADFLAATVNTLYRNYPPNKLKGLMNFLGSHDTERIATVLGGEEDMGEENAILAVKRMSKEQRESTLSLLKQAYLLLASLPGVPCIYYGDEIGMEGYHDPFNRRPFPPSRLCSEDSEFFARVNKMRAGEPLFKAEELRARALSDGVVEILRIGEGGRLLVIANMSNGDYHTKLNNAIDLFGQEECGTNITVSAKSVKIFKIED